MRGGILRSLDRRRRLPAYFAEAMWDTDRVGSVAYISNQSLLGLVARLRPEHPDRLLWLGLVVVVLLFWVRRAARSDPRAGFALTGLASCLISPVTSVHHLVWAVPALLLMAERGRQWTAGICYFLLCTSLVWLWPDAAGVLGVVGGNAYVLVSLVLLAQLPVHRVPEVPPAPPAPLLAGTAAIHRACCARAGAPVHGVPEPGRREPDLNEPRRVSLTPTRTIATSEMESPRTASPMLTPGSHGRRGSRGRRPPN